MSGLLSSFQGHLGILIKSWQGSTDASRVEEGDQGLLGIQEDPQQGIQTSLHVGRGNTGLHLSHCWENMPYLE